MWAEVVSREEIMQEGKGDQEEVWSRQVREKLVHGTCRTP